MAGGGVRKNVVWGTTLAYQAFFKAYSCNFGKILFTLNKENNQGTGQPWQQGHLPISTSAIEYHPKW